MINWQWSLIKLNFLNNICNGKQNFFKSKVWDKVPAESNLIFRDTKISDILKFPFKGSFYAKNQLNEFSCFNTILACDRQPQHADTVLAQHCMGKKITHLKLDFYTT